MSPSASSILQRALDILRSKHCWCMRSKYPNHPFCAHCYGKLTAELRDAIARRGPVFVQNYDRAVEYLKPHVRPAKVVPSKTQKEQFGYPD